MKEHLVPALGMKESANRSSQFHLCRRFCHAACLVIFAGVWTCASASLKRVVPEPLPGHPGNIFLAGDGVTVPLPPGDTGQWRALDYEGRLVASGPANASRAELGRLPIGYYEIQQDAAAGARTNRITLGVLARLPAPTPATSPVGIDVAMAWFYKEGRMPAAANLCALAGMNWVRDRLSWPEMEPARGRFSGTNRYDSSARIQSAAGLRVLQVAHISPSWANPQTKRFPLDLRDAYTFYREMTRRWRGQVIAFEPWNEADIEMFGGHTGSEMASLQKAAYLGLKAADPNATACLNVFAIHRASTLRDLQDNESWPYFDTFNLHHYEPFANYPKLYADFRAASAGRPLWVTECSLPVKWAGDDKLKEPIDADLRVQAERVAKTYALAIHEGARAVFYFLLPHYVEGQTQFGIVRPDLTPRPAFVALAAAGRLLADAKPLGRVKTDSALQAYAFAARPDGKKRTVVVAWTTAGEASLQLKRKPAAVLDLLGRALPVNSADVKLSTAPRFLVADSADVGPFDPPPQPARWQPGRPSSVVLQAVLPTSQLVLSASGYRVRARTSETVPVFAYNFSSRTVRGQLHVEAPAGCAVDCPTELELVPGERRELALKLRLAKPMGTEPERLRIAGDFGSAGIAVLSLRLCAAEQGKPSPR